MTFSLVTLLHPEPEHFREDRGNKPKRKPKFKPKRKPKFKPKLKTNRLNVFMKFRKRKFMLCNASFSLVTLLPPEPGHFLEISLSVSLSLSLNLRLRD